MRASEFINEKKLPDPTKSQCQTKRLSNVRYSQCVSLGLKARDSDHTDGSGKQGVKGSGKSVRGRRAKSEKYGGPVRDYSGHTRSGK